MRKTFLFFGFISLFSFLASVDFVYAQEEIGLQKAQYVVPGGYIVKSCECYAYAIDVADGVDIENNAYETTNTKDGKTIRDRCIIPEGKEVQVNGEAWGLDTIQIHALSFSSMMGGMCSSNDPNRLAGFINNSLIGKTTQAIDLALIRQPASGAEFMAYALGNAHIIEPAYAQGIGYSGLFPLIDLWRVFRNISYIILVIVLVVVGFMIMFRMNIDAQTVISIQNALPGIVITLILITFSYAIAGILIDLMYFVIFLLVSLFGQVQGIPPDKIAGLQEVYINSNTWSLFKAVMNGENSNLTALPGEFISEYTFAGETIISLLGGLLLKSVSGAVIGLLVTALPILIVAIALFFSFLRILMILISSYITIIIYVIFAPLLLLRGAIPGNNAFVSWLRTLVGNLSVFPTTAGVFLLIASIVSRIKPFGEGNANLWSPPFLFGPTIENHELLVALIGIGMLVMAPTLILQVKNALGEKPAIPVSPAIFLGPTTGLIGRGITGFSTLNTFSGDRLASAVFGQRRPAPPENGPKSVTEVLGKDVGTAIEGQ